MTPPLPRLFAALEATWPPAARQLKGSFLLREGRGGGKRVSAATLEAEGFTGAGIAEAEAGMRALGQPPLFMLRDQPELDAALEARGYGRIDETLFYAAPAQALAEHPPHMTLLPCWPPLAIQRRIWAEAGIGPERVAVMLRAAGPRAAFVARFRDRAAGVGFCALHDGIAMLHALEVVPEFRRQGLARVMVRAIAAWALEQGADWFALAVTERNLAARALYSGLNMAEAGAYHYRQRPEAP